MVTLQNSVIDKLVTFDKVANYELPKNVSEWNEEILDQFFEQVNYLPKEFNVDIVVDNVDENEGYAKGSVVVWYNDKQVNFPVIVKDYQLSPFDVFVCKEGDTTLFYSANLNNIKKALTADKIGKLENRYPRGSFEGVKSISGIWPKQSINVADYPELQTYPPFSKMSGWPILAKKEDLEKLAVQLKAKPNVGRSFVDNTGDLVSNVINVKGKRVVAEDNKKGILDLKNVVKAKRAVTVIDSQFFDVNKLMPLSAPVVGEVKLYEYPSMEDFIERGKNMAGRFLATKVGKSLHGVILDYKDSYDLRRMNDRCPAVATSGSNPDKTLEQKREMRERRNQVFISLSGKYYCTYNDYDKHGIGFYGSKIISHDQAVEKAVKMIARNSTDEFTSHDKDNKSDGADKSFNRIKEMEQGKRGRDELCCESSYNCGRLMVIFGSQNSYECVSFNSMFRKFKVNDSNVYVSKNEAIIPANIASLQRVSSVKDPVYKMVIGKVKNIYLVPEGSHIINTDYMQKLDENDFMRPARSICKTYEEAEINKVAMSIHDGKYKITGKPFEPLMKIAGINGAELGTNDAFMSLQIMGVDQEMAKTAMKVAINRASDDSVADKEVKIFGVRDDYINMSVLDDLKKEANVRNLFKEFCDNLRVDLVKEASALDDPEAVDVVLSLNFVNEDSLKGYVDNIKEMKKVAGKLAELLVASRMGLSNVEESAVKKSMEGLETVVDGLEQVKMAVDK